MTSFPTADTSPAAELASPEAARRRLIKLSAWRDAAREELARVQRQRDELRRYLALSEKVTLALETLSQQLFRELLDVIEEKLTIALQEVLDDVIKLRCEVDWKRNGAAVDFWIERDGHREDILRGQGGSVTNILSVGLRMFALTTLPEEAHRRFLVLDEQDCWLRPDLVPRLVKIIHDAGHALGFQVLLISHHDAALFERYAERIYRFTPGKDGHVDVSLVENHPAVRDAGA